MGSFNNDRWSWKMNNECNVAVYDDPVHTAKMLEVHERFKERA